MNKARITGIIISFIGLILIYKVDINSWLINALFGAIIGFGFSLIAFGKYNLKNEN